MNYSFIKNKSCCTKVEILGCSGSGAISLTGLLHQTDWGKDGVIMSSLQKIEEKSKPCCLAVLLSKPEIWKFNCCVTVDVWTVFHRLPWYLVTFCFSGDNRDKATTLSGWFDNLKIKYLEKFIFHVLSTFQEEHWLHKMRRVICIGVLLCHESVVNPAIFCSTHSQYLNFLSVSCLCIPDQSW